MLTILLDENLEGYAAFLSRCMLSAGLQERDPAIAVRIVTFTDVGLANGSTDEQVWDFCQREEFYLFTDNRNQDTPDSLEAIIRGRSVVTSLPVFTIATMKRFRRDQVYPNVAAAKLIDYLMDAENIRGTGRLFVP